MGTFFRQRQIFSLCQNFLLCQFSRGWMHPAGPRLHTENEHRGCWSDWPRRGFPSPQDRTKSGQNRHLGVRGPYSIQAVAIFGRSAISKKNARNLVKTGHLFGFVHECRGVSLRFRRKDTRARSFGLRIPARYARGRQGVSVLDSCRKSNIR